LKSYIVSDVTSSVDPYLLFKEMVEFVFVMVLYPVISVANFAVQIIKWLYSMLVLSRKRSFIDFETVCITGGSSGIGLCLAREICTLWKESMPPENVNRRRVLTLVARDEEKLSSIKNDLVKYLEEGSVDPMVDVQVRPCDTLNEEKIKRIVTEIDYDMIIASAGKFCKQIFIEYVDTNLFILQFYLFIQQL